MSSNHSHIASNYGHPKSGQHSGSSNLAKIGKETESFKVLLVDDNVDLLEMTAELFKTLGFEVFIACNGEEALEILESRPHIEAVLSDVVMPGMSGVELAYEVRKRFPLTKIILVSGYPNLANHIQQGTLYDFKFMKKPYRVDEIVRLIVKPS